MKKNILSISLIVIFPLAFAQQEGYTGPSRTNNQNTEKRIDSSTNIITIVHAKKLGDDQYVTLRGNIVQHLYKDNYVFQDKTDKINIEIDHDKWQGLSVGANDLVEIYGKIDKDKRSIEIDVKSIRKIN